jgi:hypothetical protein
MGLISGALWLGTPVALAQTDASAPLPACGSTPKGSTQKALATLALDGESPELVTDGKFGHKTGHRDLLLVFKVTGCDAAGRQAKPQEPLAIYPTKTGDQVPDGAVRLRGDPSMEGSGTVYRVPLRVFSNQFDPGSYSGFVELKAPWMNPARVPVTVSRSENNLLVPLSWGLIGAVFGLVVFVLMQFAQDFELAGHWYTWLLVGLVSVGAGVYVSYKTSYLDQDIWTSGENGVAAAVAGFTGATAGSTISGLFGWVFKKGQARVATRRATE